MMFLVFYKFLNFMPSSFRSPQSTLERGGAKDLWCEMCESRDEVSWFTFLKS
jgi:hypothetical protein